jgi:hypothetical protein
VYLNTLDCQSSNSAICHTPPTGPVTNLCYSLLRRPPFHGPMSVICGRRLYIVLRLSKFTEVLTHVSQSTLVHVIAGRLPRLLLEVSLAVLSRWRRKPNPSSGSASRSQRRRNFCVRVTGTVPNLISDSKRLNRSNSEDPTKHSRQADPLQTAYPSTNLRHSPGIVNHLFGCISPLGKMLGRHRRDRETQRQGVPGHAQITLLTAWQTRKPGGTIL